LPLRAPRLTRPILMGGVPRVFAILNATIGAAIGFGLQQPFIGFPLWAVLQGAAPGPPRAIPGFSKLGRGTWPSPYFGVRRAR
jgi:type IV secretory pathway TrbD component